MCLVCLMTLALPFNETSPHFEERVFFSLSREKNNLLALRFGDSTAESPGDATHVDAALTLCAEFSSPQPHASNDPPRVSSPNQNLQFLSWLDVSLFFLRP